MPKAKPSRSRGSIQERSPGVWTVRVTAGFNLAGKRITKAVTVKGNRKAAQLELARLISATGAGEKMTFESAAKRWLSIREGMVSITTYQRNEQLIRKVTTLAPRFAGLDPNEIRPSDIDQLAQMLRTAGRDMTAKNSGDNPSLSARTVKQAIGAIRLVFNMLERDGALRSNPARLATPISTKDAPTGVHLELDDAQRLLDHLEGYIQQIVNFSLGTGIRRSEVLALKWSDISLSAGTVTVRHSIRCEGKAWVIAKPKTKASQRTITLPNYLIQSLTAMKTAQCEAWVNLFGQVPNKPWFVFQNPRDPAQHANPTTVTKAVGAALKKLGIEGTFHSLRHSHASLLLVSEPLPTVSKRLGHASTAVTALVYSHALAGSDQKAADAIDLLFRTKVAQRQVASTSDQQAEQGFPQGYARVLKTGDVERRP